MMAIGFVYFVFLGMAAGERTSVIAKATPEGAL
jgi:hypothetical protein